MIRSHPRSVVDDYYVGDEVGYHPDSRVAARINPYDSAPAQLGPPQHGPPNYIPAQAAPDKIRQSDEQGVGRAPGQDWPHMPHVFQFNPSMWHNFAWLEGGDPGNLMAPSAADSRTAPGGYRERVIDRPAHWEDALAWWQQQPAAGKHVWPGPVTAEPAPSMSYAQANVLDLGGSHESNELLGGGLA